MKLYNPKNVWRLQRPHQTYSHNLHFKITLSSGRIHPCKDQVYSHNLHFKITELARFNPETVLRQDTLLLYNPKECREGKKKVCPFLLLENSRPLSPWGPLDSLSTCLGNDSLNSNKLRYVDNTHSNDRKQRGTKEPLDEGEGGE